LQGDTHSGEKKCLHGFDSGWRCELTNNDVRELQELPSNRHDLSENRKISVTKKLLPLRTMIERAITGKFMHLPAETRFLNTVDRQCNGGRRHVQSPWLAIPNG
jgi:hypothetical protein